jgi:hypothetical protein
MVLSLDRKKELLRGRPNAWTACPEDFRWLRLPVRVEQPRDVFQPQRFERMFSPGASHLTECHTRKRSVCADIR